jgi:hypothetical protein
MVQQPTTLVYVAAPFSAPTREGVEANIVQAVELGIEVAKLGACPIIPHANTAHPAFEQVQPYTFWIEATLALLRRCNALLAHPKWPHSRGATAEVADAIKRGQPVFYELEALRKWMTEFYF